MKKITSLFLSVFCVLNLINAQDITVFNYDGVTPIFSNGGWGDTFEQDANPLSDGVNNSTNVGKLTEYNAWSPGNSTTVDIDSRVYNSFDVSVYSPNSTTGKVQIQLKDASGNQLDWFEQTVSSSTGWIKLTRNLGFAAKIASVVVFWNHTVNPKGTTEDIVYLDNLVFKKSTNPFLTLYGETFAASWSQWGSWSGAPSTKAGSWFGKVNLQTAADAVVNLDRYWDAYEHVLRVAPANEAVIIPDIDVAGFDSLKLSADISWPWSQVEQDAGYYGVGDAEKSPIIDVKVGTGDWINVPTTPIAGWTTQVILLRDGSGNPISNVSTISIRLSHTPLFTSVYDNVKILGKIHYAFTGAVNSDPTNASNWNGGFVPESTNQLTVTSGSMVLSQNAAYDKIIVEPTAKLTLNDTKTLTISELTLKSNVNGTATFVDNNTSPSTIVATVQQYLPATNRNWYVSAPISSATNTNLSTGAGVVEYNEETGNWDTVTGSLNPMKGYISTAGSAGTGTLSFYGDLNSGSKSIVLSRKGATKAGFNLVGNPYPSYLKWTESLANSANCLTTIWYRTNTAGVYSFETYNASGDLGVPLSTSGYIPPMQAFWVRTTVDGSTLTVNNSMRSHGNGSANLLKAPSMQSDRKIIRLQLSNKVGYDETVLYSDANATSQFDKFDSPKMSGAENGVPQIYTLVDGEKMVINGMNSIPENIEIPLNITGNSELKIKATEMSNLGENAVVWLIDKISNQTFDLSNGSEYVFDNSGTDSSTNRLSLIYRTNNTVTSYNTLNRDNIFVYSQNGNIIVDGYSSDIQVFVYNSIGKIIFNKKFSSKNAVIEKEFAPGIYLIKTIYDGRELNRRIILN